MLLINKIFGKTRMEHFYSLLDKVGAELVIETLNCVSFICCFAALVILLFAIDCK